MRLSIRLLSVCSLSAALFCTSYAQTTTLDIVGGGTGLTSYAGFHDPKGLLKKNTMDYKDIEGTCFWRDEWSPAILVFDQGKNMIMERVKLNFYSKEAHYLDKNGEEFTLIDEHLKKIYFLDPKDTTKATAFQKYKFPQIGNAYAQVMNNGTVQFLKLTITNVKKNDYNQYRRAETFRFVSAKKYFIHVLDQLMPLKSLNKANVLSVIQSSKEIEPWLESHNNKLKTEGEVSAFFNFYNTIAR